MEYSADTKHKRERSPSFPFISLEKAIERAQQFADAYKRHEARVHNIGSVWQYKEMSGAVFQTIAALKSFGLIEEAGGTKSERKVKLTDLAWRLLHDERPGARQNAIKEAALGPRLFADHWELWGTHRPPDVECISDLHLEKGFTKDAAERFLSIYDDTISYAKLTESGTLIDHKDNKEQQAKELQPERIISLQTLQSQGSEVKLMEDERVVYTYESDPCNRLRLIVSGSMNEELLDAIKIYVELQERKFLSQRANEKQGHTLQSPAVE